MLPSRRGNGELIVLAVHPFHRNRSSPKHAPAETWFDIPARGVAGVEPAAGRPPASRKPDLREILHFPSRQQRADLGRETDLERQTPVTNEIM